MSEDQPLIDHPTQAANPGPNPQIDVAADSAEPVSDSPSRVPAWADEAVDALLVVVLSLAAVAAAWSGYQAARWSGVQASNYAQASARRVESTRASTTANQLTIIDVMTFTNYVNAWLTGDAELADFYHQHFRAEFLPAFDAWMATDPLNNPDAPPSPFAMAEYAPAGRAQADQLEAEAEAFFVAGADANEQADDYVLNTVFLATVLFFAGIAPRVRWLPAQLVLVALAVILLGVGLYNLATYPIE